MGGFMGTPTLWGRGNISSDEIQSEVFREAQKHIDQVNQRFEQKFENEFREAYTKLEVAARMRSEIWEQYVLGPTGLAVHCRNLKKILEEVDTDKKQCAEAQAEFDNKGLVDGNGNNLSEKDVKGCADQAYTHELKMKKCELIGERLACSWLRDVVIPNLKLREWFEPPRGICLVTPNADFNLPLLPQSELDNLMW